MSQGTVINNLNVGMVTKWVGTLLYGSKWCFMSPYTKTYIFCSMTPDDQSEVIVSSACHFSCYRN